MRETESKGKVVIHIGTAQAYAEFSLAWASDSFPAHEYAAGYPESQYPGPHHQCVVRCAYFRHHRVRHNHGPEKPIPICGILLLNSLNCVLWRETDRPDTSYGVNDAKATTEAGESK